MSRFGTAPPSRNTGFGSGRSSGDGGDGKVFCQDECYLHVKFTFEEAFDDRFSTINNKHLLFDLSVTEAKRKRCTEVDQPPSEELSESCNVGWFYEDQEIYLNGYYHYFLKMVNMGKDRPKPKKRCKDFTVWSDPIAGEEDKLLACCHGGPDCTFTIKQRYKPAIGEEVTITKMHDEGECQKSTLCKDEDTHKLDIGVSTDVDSMPKCLEEMLDNIKEWIKDSTDENMMGQWVTDCQETIKGMLGDFGGTTTNWDCVDKKIQDEWCPKMKEIVDDFAYECSCKIQGGY
jgi:hypothetical protein